MYRSCVTDELGCFRANKLRFLFFFLERGRLMVADGLIKVERSDDIFV